MDLSQTTITVLGAQRSGQALARLIVQLKGTVKISEHGKKENISRAFYQWIKKKNIAIECDGHTKAFIQESDLVVISPGVVFNSLPFQWAKEKGIPIMGEIEFAAQFCDKPIIAITGTSGKTTVSTLIHQVLEKAGYSSVLCGNIGKPFAAYVLDLKDKDFVVLEVSSFQLESTIHFHPHIAVWLNFTQNHLDRHKDMEEYFKAKRKIFSNQTSADFAILNGTNEKMKGLKLKAKVCDFNMLDDQYTENQKAVWAVAQAVGISENICQQVFDHFKGIEHRLEKVRVIDGVQYINDSKSTTVESGRWALKHSQQPLFMICGGRDKNSDFSVLRDTVQKRVKKMLVFGEAKEKLWKAFEKVVEIEKCSDLKEAVLKAKKEAMKGDTIVFSPMCASFDMFKNFEDRGKAFKEIVNQL